MNSGHAHSTYWRPKLEACLIANDEIEFSPGGKSAADCFQPNWINVVSANKFSKVERFADWEPVPASFGLLALGA